MRGELAILVVDDDASLRTAYARLLSVKFGFSGYALSVFEASDGASALTVLSERRIDLVLSDWNMPGMNGEALARNIQELGYRVPVFIVTGAPDNLKKSCVGVEKIFSKTDFGGVFAAIDARFNLRAG